MAEIAFLMMWCKMPQIVKAAVFLFMMGINNHLGNSIFELNNNSIFLLVC